MKPHYFLWTAALCLLGVLAWPVCALYNGLSDAIADRSYCRWDRAHHVAHGYRVRQPDNLYLLRLGLLEYAQHHQGSLPPMQNAAIAQLVLMSYVNHIRPFYNLTTDRPLVPNAALSNLKYHSITNRSALIAFYDPKPPEGYPEVYYVTLSGHVDHVSLSHWPQIWQAARTAAL